MAHIPSYYLFILILIFSCYSILVTEGRPLKSMKTQDVSHHQDNEKDAEKKLITAYRPTTPGKSPGAGHSFTEHRVEDQSEALVNFPRIDPTSTERGHSPGAGHSIHN
ncbi:putative encoded peptide [Helianthus annuus]|nr:putative encoded peptide [Helianthus annuus]